MNAFAVIPLVSFIIILFAAAHITAQNRRTRVNLAFLALSLSLGSWAFVTFLAKLPLPDGWTAWFFRVSTVFWIPMGGLWLLFVYAFLGRRSPLVVWGILATALIACGVSLTTEQLHGDLQFGPWGGYLETGPAFPYVALGLVVLPLLYGIVLVARHWRHETRPVERQIAGVLWQGSATALVVGATTDILLPVFFRTQDAPQIAHMVGALFALLLWYTVRRHNIHTLSLARAAPDVFDSLHEGVLLVDRDGRIHQANPAAERLFGRSEAPSLRERPVEDVIPGWGGADLAQPEARFETETGGRVLSISRSTHQAENHPVGDILLVRDITERKHAEVTLRRANELLETRVAERTSELEEANKRLQQEMEERVQAESALIRTERLAAVGTLAGGMAHEFNNINVTTLGFAELGLLDPSLSEDARDCLERIRRAALRARSVTQNLLAYSGAPGHLVQTGDLLDVIEESVSLVRRDFETDGVCVRLDLRHAPSVAMDRDQIGQVIVNLLINARHALLDRDHREIVIRAGVDEAHPPERVWFHVADTGCGIPPEAQSRIFTPFYTTKGEFAHGETSQARVRGTGLGLAVCHTIIERHKGTIEVESTPGEGSIFTVRLPVRTAAAAPDAPADDEDTRTPQARILVVDDEDDVRDLLRIHLGRAGFAVDATDDGGDACRRAEEGETDLVLLDLKMPRMSGESILERLERLPEERRPPVILITGKDTGVLPLVRRCEMVVACLRKPFELDDLIRRVRNALCEAEDRSDLRPAGVTHDDASSA